MSIIVIGGNGYLGCHVAKFFGADSLSRQNGFDITDLHAIEEKLKDYDVIIHMAAKIDKSDENPEEVFRVNATGTFNLVRCLNASQTLIFTSTKEVKKPALESAYDYSKLIAEKYIEFYGRHIGFKYGIFRLATTYAPSIKGKTWVNELVDKVKYDGVVNLFHGGEQIRDFLYVDDLCNAFEMFLKSDIGWGTHEIGVFDIGGGSGNAMKIIQFVETVGEVLEKKPNICFVDDISELNQGECHYIADNRKLFVELGWKPECSIEKGIRYLL